QVCGRRNLVEAFLHAIFPKVALAGCGRFTHGGFRKGLGDGDEGGDDRRRGEVRRRLQAAAHLMQLLADHATGASPLMLFRMPLVISACSPSGASLRYSSNAFTASGS